MPFAGVTAAADQFLGTEIVPEGAATRAAPGSESGLMREGDVKLLRGDQKSRRRASWPVRFPPNPWGRAASNIPKVLGLPMFKAGGAKFV